MTLKFKFVCVTSGYHIGQHSSTAYSTVLGTHSEWLIILKNYTVFKNLAGKCIALENAYQIPGEIKNLNGNRKGRNEVH